MFRIINVFTILYQTKSGKCKSFTRTGNQGELLAAIIQIEKKGSIVISFNQYRISLSEGSFRKSILAVSRQTRAEAMVCNTIISTFPRTAISLRKNKELQQPSAVSLSPHTAFA